MNIRIKVALGILTFSTVSFAQIINSGVPDSFQVNYASNLSTGQTINPLQDTFIDITNNGASALVDPSPGNICVNIYAFDPSSEMLSCCACVVSPNGLVSLGVKSSLLSNTLTGEMPSSAVVKLIASNPPGDCDPTSIAPSQLVPGMRAWRATLHSQPATPTNLQITENEFSNSDLSVAELARLTNFCSFIISNGSGAGICKGCELGALSATTSR